MLRAGPGSRSGAGFDPQLFLWPAEDEQCGTELPLNPLWREIPSNCASLAKTQRPQQTLFTQKTIKTA